jgi:Mlc titration factor MtfA (ptsG expression regulator)
VRAERREDRAYGLALAVLAAALPPTVGALYSGGMGAMAGGVIGLGAAAAVQAHFARRARRRLEVLAGAFPGPWREVLQQRYDHYDRLPEPERRRFEDDLRLFLAEARITGVGVIVTDELRVLVAASAVTLSLGWPDYEWTQLTEVLLYPQNFDRDYGFDRNELAGQAHGWGTVILSVPALQDSFDDPDDAFHVGLHEFAHLLGHVVGTDQLGGIPNGLTAAGAEEWAKLSRTEMARLRRGEDSVMDEYGADEPAEFLAVAVEAFFEAPLAMRQDHAPLYRLLAGYFRQDPAAWDDARGLTLED